MPDAWRLAVGTLTALPVRPPAAVDARIAARAVLLAPAAALPVAVVVAGIGVAGRRAELAPIAVACVAVLALALGTRAFHLDGLADTADGLTASYDRERSLAVMKSGPVGPAGAVALVLVLGVQVGSLTALFATDRGAVLAGVLVCLSRVAHSVACRPGVPSANPHGLGAAYGACLPLPAVVGLWTAAATAAAVVGAWAELAWWRGPVGVLAAAMVVVVLVRRAVRRLGGVTGDVMGATIEVALAVLLLSVT